MPLTAIPTYEFDRPIEGFAATRGKLKSAMNGMTGVMPCGRALTFTTDQSMNSVFPTMRVVNSATDVVAGFSVHMRVGMIHYDPINGVNSELTTINPTTMEVGYPIKASVAYTDGEEPIYVVCETAAKPGDPVHVRAVPGAGGTVLGRIRNAAVAGETIPATGWQFRETCTAGQTVRIYKP
jgi:hypothetical protein